MTQRDPAGFNLFDWARTQTRRLRPSPPNHAPTHAATHDPAHAAAQPSSHLANHNHPPEHHLRTRLAGKLRHPLGTVTLTHNKGTLYSYMPDPKLHGTYNLRIHRTFATAPDDVLHALTICLRLGKPRTTAGRRERTAALALLRRHFEEHVLAHAEARRARVILRPVGVCVDLREIRDAINARYFDGKINVQITWGKALSATDTPATTPPRATKKRARPRRSLQLGSYSFADGVVRIHRVLNRADVPRHVIEAVVHHEMLHAAMPPTPGTARRQLHTRAFREREREFEFYDEAQRWISTNLNRLLTLTARDPHRA